MNIDGDRSPSRDDAYNSGGDEDYFTRWWLTRDHSVEDELEDDIWDGAVYAAFDDSAFLDPAVYAQAPEEIRGVDPVDDFVQPDGPHPSDDGYDESGGIEAEQTPYEHISPESSIDHWSVDDFPVEDEGVDPGAL